MRFRFGRCGGTTPEMFAPWLAANPGLLGKELQMDLELEGKEVAVGTSSADLVLRDTNTGQRVVVKNMLETTDHDHLGKLITYAAALEARWAVLVARQFRPDHRSALTWLGSISGKGSGFLGIDVHAVRIADSPTAVRLDMVVKPDDFSRRARAGATSVSETGDRYIEWQAEFLPKFHAVHPGWSNAQKPSSANWMNFPSGKGGVSYGLSFAYPTGASNYSLSAHVYMDDGDSVYPAHEAQRSVIEAALRPRSPMGPRREQTILADRGVSRPCRSHRPCQMAPVPSLGHRDTRRTPPSLCDADQKPAVTRPPF